MDKKTALHELKSSRQFLLRSASIFTEEDAGYAPAEGMYTVAGQLAHIAITVDWFIRGAESPDGFDMDFEAHDQAARAVTTLAEAHALIDKHYNAAEAWLAEADLAALLPEGMVMGGAPKAEVVFGLVDHAAHHRGALSVYARTMGKVAPMPYM
jgi:uncharacterized damage-inducible protein DinB